VRLARFRASKPLFHGSIGVTLACKVALTTLALRGLPT